MTISMVKYVMIDYVKPIIFSGVEHKSMKAAGNITSAGFVVSVNGHLEAMGESLSLGGMKPFPEDGQIIEQFMIKIGLRSNAAEATHG